MNWQTPLAGRVLFLRRTDGAGSVSLLGHSFGIANHWVHRLIRAEVDLDSDRIRFYALHRREPEQQPLLREVRHRVPRKRFRE